MKLLPIKQSPEDKKDTQETVNHSRRSFLRKVFEVGVATTVLPATIITLLNKGEINEFLDKRHESELDEDLTKGIVQINAVIKKIQSEHGIRVVVEDIYAALQSWQKNRKELNSRSKNKKYD